MYFSFSGVEAQTVTVWRQADRYAVPRITYINKMDKRGADFDMSVSSLRHKLQVQPLVLQVPIGSEANFTGVIDLVHMELLSWGTGRTTGIKYECRAVSDGDACWESALAGRYELVEQLADLDEDIADAVLSDIPPEDIPSERLQQAVRRVTLASRAVPVLCGSSHKNKGVQPLLDAITHYLPSPADIKHDFLQHYPDTLVALAFKIIHDRQRGPLTFLRVYGGQVSSGGTVYNINRQLSEKVTRIYEVKADEYKEVTGVTAGGIAALAGLKEVRHMKRLEQSIIAKEI